LPKKLEIVNSDSNEEQLPKKLEDYEIDKPKQLTLFEFLEEKDMHLSNTIDIWDLLPRFSKISGKKEGKLKKVKFYPVIKVGDHNLEFELSITPALIEDKNGKLVPRYPGTREKVVELGIRKLAFSGYGQYMDGQMGVLFTLNDLHKLLKGFNRGYKISDLRDAIEILRKSTLEIKCLNRNFFPDITLSYINDTYIQTKQAFNAKINSSKCFVVFNSMVTDSINQKTLRAYNMKKCMGYRYDLAEYIHVRIIRNFKQAQYNDPKNGVFSISQETLERDSGMTIYKNSRDNKAQVIKALEKMKSSETIDKYSFKDKKEGRKKIGVTYYLKLSNSFCEEILSANIKTHKQDFLRKLNKAKSLIEEDFRTRVARKFK